MSFQDITKLSNSSENACAILYNFNNKELTMLKNICGLIGIKEKIILTPKNGNSLVKDVLEGKLDDKCENGLINKAVVFNNVDHSKIHSFIDSLKKFRIPTPLIAVVTETSLNWDINTLVGNLLEEREALKAGKPINH